MKEHIKITLEETIKLTKPLPLLNPEERLEDYEARLKTIKLFTEIVLSYLEKDFK